MCGCDVYIEREEEEEQQQNQTASLAGEQRTRESGTSRRARVCVGRVLYSREIQMGKMGFDGGMEQKIQMPLMALNHVSFVVRSVSRSVEFYEQVLGFTSVKRPSSFSFEGAWLFNHGLGIHLLESTKPEQLPERKGPINPKDNHISFQCSDMGLLAWKLKAMGVEYVTAVVEENGVTVDQLFFHDPDGYMVEICNCHVLPVLPISSSCPLGEPLRPAGEDATVTEGSFDSGAAVRGPVCAAEGGKKTIDNLIAGAMSIILRRFVPSHEHNPAISPSLPSFHFLKSYSCKFLNYVLN